jgi:hypothetical protein
VRSEVGCGNADEVWRVVGRLALDRKSGPHSQCTKSKLSIYLTFLS